MFVTIVLRAPCSVHCALCIVLIRIDRSQNGAPYRANASIEELATICSLCNDSSIDYAAGKYKKIGEATEAALITLVEKLNVLNDKLNSNAEARTLQCNAALRQKWSKVLFTRFQE